jgi:uncharacterized protein
MTIPSDAEIENLHRKYAPNDEIYTLVYTHCKIVAEIAAQLIIIKTLQLNQELVRAGCMLHDIGVYKLFINGTIDDSNYIKHGILGEEILKSEGFPSQLSRIAAHHTGVGISINDIQNNNLPLPEQDYLAETDEELLVMYADKFHSKTPPPRFNTADSYKANIARFGKDKVEKFEKMIEMFGIPELGELSRKYGHSII